MHCAHCLADSTPDQSSDDYTAEFFEAIKQMPALGIDALDFTGGEFFYWDGAEAALALLKSLSMRVSILTNGILLNDDLVLDLKEMGASLCFSVEGPRDIHDSLRGRGNYDLVVEKMAVCKQAGIRFTVASTVTKPAVSQMPHTANNLLALGAKVVYFSPLHRIGRGRFLPDDLHPDQDDYVNMLARFLAMRDAQPEESQVALQNIRTRAYTVENPCFVFACSGEFCHNKKYWPTKLFIMPDGELLPQSLHIHKNYSLGNIVSESMVDLVNNYWGSPKHDEFLNLCRYIYQDKIYASDAQVFLWDELLAAASVLTPDSLPKYETVSHPYDHTEEIARARRKKSLE